MKNHNLLEGRISSHMLRLALPNMGGMLAMVIFNITDTFFVSLLGDDALAAMGFTFPIVMIVGSFSSGIATGSGSLLARASGSNDRKLMERIASDGILLALAIVLVISTAGIIWREPLFRALGAEGAVLKLVDDFMFFWFLGALFNVMPPISDMTMRAMGEMKLPLYVMVTVAILNVILDPLLIFGLYGFPELGISGASIATVISRAIGGILSLTFVHVKFKLLNFRYSSFRQILQSWKRILHIGVPGAMIRLLPQIVRAVLTRMAAWAGGATAVAALAAASRIESFAMVLSMAVGVSLVPILGQNYGAQKYERVAQTRSLVIRLAVIFGILSGVIMFFVAVPIGTIFSDNPEVLAYIRQYLVILMFGSIGLNMYNWISEGLNALGKPKSALQINMYGTLFLLVPATAAGALVAGFTGMISFLAGAQILLGIISARGNRRQFQGA